MLTPKPFLVTMLAFSLYLANPNDLARGGVVPLNKIPSEQWIEKVSGDMDSPGLPFVIRIHHDAGPTPIRKTRTSPS